MRSMPSGILIVRKALAQGVTRQLPRDSHRMPSFLYRCLLMVWPILLIVCVGAVSSKRFKTNVTSEVSDGHTRWLMDVGPAPLISMQGGARRWSCVQ